MKQVDINRQSFLKYGIPDDIIGKLLANSYTVSKARTAPLSDLENFLTEEEAKAVKDKASRQPIPNDVFERLVKETELHCCFCWDITSEQPVIIHHIDEYNKTQDNSFNNLIVLCLNHHAEIHTKRQISQQNFPKIRQLTQKEQWISALAEYRAGKRPAPGSERASDIINVVNSPGAIVTNHQKGNNLIVNQTLATVQRLVYFRRDTQSKIDTETGRYTTRFVFGSDQGIALSNLAVSLRFDTVFTSVRGYIAGNGMVVTGKLDRKVHKDNKGYDFATDFLNSNNFIVIQTDSESILEIAALETRP